MTGKKETSVSVEYSTKDVKNSVDMLSQENLNELGIESDEIKEVKTNFAFREVYREFNGM